MEYLSHGRDLKRGDVLMVHHRFIPRGQRNERVWKFFGVVLKSGNRFGILHRIVPGKDGQTEYSLNFNSPMVKAFKLEPDEWPDGVHQIRMQLILTGEIDL